ncbi:hypothetical protein [Polyangium sp. y55x31]|uniref:hypothetical protein n=1 Tax=Polyangium sp. y55x31 TaxID=3042688 RepID=UPI0024822549|nr:hypothetical protein [Polyangium sp. y55x31]MDI1482526.1 hypothetical protein [Polyangium sp. y55x31]
MTPPAHLSPWLGVFLVALTSCAQPTTPASTSTSPCSKSGLSRLAPMPSLGHDPEPFRLEVRASRGMKVDKDKRTSERLGLPFRVDFHGVVFEGADGFLVGDDGTIVHLAVDGLGSEVYELVRQ